MKKILLVMAILILTGCDNTSEPNINNDQIDVPIVNNPVIDDKSKLDEIKKYGNYEFSDAKFSVQDGIGYFFANVKNIGESELPGQILKVFLFNGTSEKVTITPVYIEKLQPNEGTHLTLNIENVDKITDYSIEKEV